MNESGIFVLYVSALDIIEFIKFFCFQFMYSLLLEAGILKAYNFNSLIPLLILSNFIPLGQSHYPIIPIIGNMLICYGSPIFVVAILFDSSIGIFALQQGL